MYWFAADLMLFYVCPLVFAGYVFCMLAGKLRKSIRGFKQAANDAEENQISAADSAECNLRGRDDRTTFALPLSDLRTVRSQERQSGEPQLLQAAMLRKMIRSRTRVYRTLVIIVILFAVTWIPYRALLIYNSLVQNPWYDLHYLFFAKTCIYFNCCFNPYLYNAMSGKFRRALVALLLYAPKPANLSIRLTDRRP
ncbi:hypothetical protein RvY_07687-2 [Ramazzottius varieornatus]|uniref:Thyrotropin-releasing hormone receptor n=1 Tax=Ramazzottius varieornatus TaxID=947166 RepID=A0A1D1V3C2_RAMVA|nr:hypothetical protein RvY_07687-2 [Ramazzottius varieornatus]